MNEHNTSNANINANAPKANSSAVIVRVRWSFMEGCKSNKEAAGDLAELKGADRDSVSSSNRIIPISILRPLRQIKSATNKFINKNTHPWDDNGGRLLPSKKITEYLKFVSQQKEKFYDERRKLRSQYDFIIEDAKKRLNGMFQPTDFPPVDEWLDRYSVRLEMETISDSDARLANVDSSVMKEIQAQVEQNVQSRITDANRNNYLRLITSIERLIGKLKAMDTGELERFRASTYDTVVEMLETADGLNFAEDPVLSKLIAQTKETFNEVCGDLNSLKENVGEPSAKRKKACDGLRDSVTALMANLPH